MSESLKTSLRWLGTGCFLALVLFVAPNCAFQTGGLCDKPDGCQSGPPPDCPPDNPDCIPQPPCDTPECPPPCDTPQCMPPDPNELAFKPGPSPTDAIMCDFPNVPKPAVSYCATQAEVDSGVYLSQSEGATALATSKHNPLTLDWSEAAKNECGGLPKKVEFLAGAFPDGSMVCIDAAQQFPNVFANPTKACIAKCEDVIALGPGPYPADVHDYCVNNAHTSTNFDTNNWYPNACSSGGTPLPGFVDPRRTPEPVQWRDLIGVTDNGGTTTLTRTAATTGNNPTDFNAGAASAQTVLNGDAWVEFEASANNTGQILSFRNSCADTTTCPDADPGVFSMGYALLLFNDGQVYVDELNAPDQALFGPFGPYTPGERYRIHAVDKHDGTATISYSRVVGPCQVGSACTEDVFYTSVTGPSYPLRVDTSIREQGATLSNVTLVRIKQ